MGASRVRAATALTGTAALAATGGIAWGIAPHRAAAEPTVDVVVVQEVTAPPARAGDPQPQPTRVLKKRVVKKRIRTSPPPVATSGAS